MNLAITTGSSLAVSISHLPLLQYEDFRLSIDKMLLFVVEATSEFLGDFLHSGRLEQIKEQH